MSGMAVSNSISAGTQVKERGFRFQVMEEEETIPLQHSISV